MCDMRIKAIARRERDGTPVLVFPDAEANFGYIVAATTEGHTEASLEWYSETKPAEFDEGFERLLGYRKEELKLVKRMTKQDAQRRWRHVYRSE